ncbi:MAG: ABC transporter ATP-binding protein [Phycisphaeraceae bacterium]|nr:ABC transporter ATP-binding protein [Phycisphaeraceae bacterium]
MIEMINLTRTYGDLVALDNLNLRIDEGDCFGFIGPNGAGKTTTIRILATLLRPTRGEARIDGLSVGPVHARQVRRIIGYVPDYFGNYPEMLVREYLEFFAAAYGITGQAREQAVDDVLSLTDLTSKADSEVNGLSRGMQQRLSLARVLIHDPKLLLLDEPSSGLDPRARVEIRELLKELHRMGKTILISSHILMELGELCDKIGIIEQGKMRFVGTPRQLMQRANVGAALMVGVGDRHEAAAKLIEQVPGVVGVRLDENLIRVELDTSLTEPSRIAAKLINSGFALEHLVEEQVSLETAFMRMTRGLVN